MKRLAVAVLLTTVFLVPCFAISTGPNEGLIILDGLALMKESGKAAAPLDYQEALTIGDKVTLLNRTSKFKVNNVDRDYTRVRAPDGKEGWVASMYVAAKASLGAVTEPQALVYSEPRDVKVTARFVTAMTLVAIPMDGSAGGFVKVLGYDPVQKYTFVDDTYLAATDVTMAENDVNAAILCTVASDTKDANIKKRLLTLATTKYPDTVFLGNIRAALGLGAPVAQRAVVEATGSYRVTADGVRIRKAPDEVNGAVIGSLKKDAVVSIVEATAESYTIGTDTAPWYHIQQPDGWVFGAFLVSAD